MLPVATQGSPLKSLSVGRTKACTWNRYLIHEPQNLFGNIVGGVITPPCGVPLSVGVNTPSVMTPEVSHALTACLMRG